MVIANEGDRFDITTTGSITSLRMLTARYRFTVRHIFALITPPWELTTLTRIVSRPDALDFVSIRSWLLKIVTLALDSDPSLVPRSSALAGLNANTGDDDFCFWSERQAKRIAYAIRTVLDIEFAPEVIVADANITTLTRRILASKQLLGP